MRCLGHQLERCCISPYLSYAKEYPIEQEICKSLIVIITITIILEKKKKKDLNINTLLFETLDSCSTWLLLLFLFFGNFDVMSLSELKQFASAGFIEHMANGVSLVG